MDLILRNHYIESREMCKEGKPMGLADCFNAEDRVQVKFSTFYEMVKGCTQRDMLMNGINCNVPHRYLREMSTGKSEEPETPVKMKPAYEMNGHEADGTFESDMWICPKCGSKYEVEHEEYDYCPKCGQGIDWE